jgi:DNA modification methylase
MLCDEVIREFTKEGDVVLDPFMGMATTAVCCVEQKRHYIGFELNEVYFDAACQRLDEVEERMSSDV